MQNSGATNERATDDKSRLPRFEQRKRMGQTTLRGAIVGCGFFSQNHLLGWREIDGVDIVAACDLDRNRAQAAADRFDSIEHVYADLERLLSEVEVDFVDIVTTMETHRPLVECAAQFGIPAIVQKPFAPTLNDARVMVDACQAAGVPLMVHENFRWQTPLLTVGKIVSSGVIGRPFFARVSFRHGNPVGYENQPYLFDQDEYIINDVGIHLFDLARFYLGEVSNIYTQKQHVNQRFKGEDVATMLLRHRNEATAIVDLSVSTQDLPDPFPQTLVRIEGTTGTATLSHNYRLDVTEGGQSREFDVAPKYYPWANEPWAIVQESVVNIQRHWVECLREGRDPDTSGVDNLNTLALTFLAYESARTGQAVVVPDPP